MIAFQQAEQRILPAVINVMRQTADQFLNVSGIFATCRNGRPWFRHPDARSTDAQRLQMTVGAEITVTGRIGVGGDAGELCAKRIWMICILVLCHVFIWKHGNLHQNVIEHRPAAPRPHLRNRRSDSRADRVVPRTCHWYRMFVDRSTSCTANGSDALCGLTIWKKDVLVLLLNTKIGILFKHSLNTRSSSASGTQGPALQLLPKKSADALIRASTSDMSSSHCRATSVDSKYCTCNYRNGKPLQFIFGLIKISLTFASTSVKWLCCSP